MFKIGDFSKISQVSIRSLRHYDEIGLLQPAQIDRFTGYRYYSADQLPRLNRILALKGLGFTLEEIKQVLDDGVTPAQIRGMLRLKQAEQRRRVAEEQTRLARVESRLKQIEQEGALPRYETILKKVPVKRVLGIRDVAPNLSQMGDLLLEAVASVRYQVRDAGPGIAVFYDDAFEDQNMDWELGFPVDQGFDGTVRLNSSHVMTVRDLPPVELMACTIYEGTYLGLHLGYSALGRWIEDNGYRIAGPNREVFLYIATNGDSNHVTEIQFPIEPAQN